VTGGIRMSVRQAVRRVAVPGSDSYCRSGLLAAIAPEDGVYARWGTPAEGIFQRSGRFIAVFPDARE